MSEPGKRLFIGARVSIATANALASAAEILARRARDGGIDVKWVPPTNYHLTLKFLGWTREATTGAIRDALAKATLGTSRITFRTARIGAFPSTDRASVVWAGIDDAGGARPITELAQRIDVAMAGLGFAGEKRAFHPHVTLGRLRETRPLRDVVLPLAEQMFGDTRIDAITLFESETKSSGSVYRDVARIEFKTPSITASEGAERQTSAVDLGASTRSSDPRSEGDDTDDGWPRGQGPNH
jgi:RNA 2',3'-cyclic 3'-phosphodiesterase